MNEKYPKFDPYDVGEEECWERYAKRIKKAKEKEKIFEYPLDKDSREFIRYGLHKSMIVNMTPVEFLRLSLPKTHIRACSLDYLFDAFEKGEPKLDPLYLRIDASTKKIDYEDYPKKKCPVYGHEGRHRAEIAMDLGIKEVPVLIDYAPSYTLDGYNEIREFDKKRQEDDWKGNYYDLALKLMKQKWKAPNDCTINNIGSESYPDIFFVKEPKWKIRKKYKELRKKYKLE